MAAWSSGPKTPSGQRRAPPGAARRRRGVTRTWWLPGLIDLDEDVWTLPSRAAIASRGLGQPEAITAGSVERPPPSPGLVGLQAPHQVPVTCRPKTAILSLASVEIVLPEEFARRRWRPGCDPGPRSAHRHPGARGGGHAGTAWARRGNGGPMSLRFWAMGFTGWPPEPSPARLPPLSRKPPGYGPGCGRDFLQGQTPEIGQLLAVATT